VARKETFLATFLDYRDEELTLQRNETAKMARMMILKRLGEKRAVSRR
jgi:hypothetical protein